MTAITNERIFRLVTLDPVHIGVGQMIMGEVDLPIDREPETGVPRFPGSALKGAFRSHADWKLRMTGEKTARCLGETPRPDKEEEVPEKGGGTSGKTITASGHCGVADCPICQTFGWSPHKKLGLTGHEGRIFFRDARLAFFPAVTDCGTFWFSTPGRAAGYLGLDLSESAGNPLEAAGYADLSFGIGDEVCLCTKEGIAELQAGWLHITEIKNAPDQAKEPCLATVFSQLKDKNASMFPGGAFWNSVAGRTVLLDESSFYRLVETCLERRTCNRINEDTGTVDEGALFSYEAVPRHALLYSRLTWNEWKDPLRKNDKVYSSPMAVCELAREGLYRMGIGGLQTRGLGSVLAEPLVVMDSREP